MDNPEFPVNLEVKDYAEYKLLSGAINQSIYHKKKWIEKGETDGQNIWGTKVEEWKAELEILRNLQHRLWLLWDLYN